MNESAAGAQGSPGQLGDQRVGELLQAAAERHEHGSGFGAGRGAALEPLHHSAEQAAVLLLHLLEHGEGALEAEFFGIGCVDAAHQGAGDFVEGLRAEAPADESGEALVLIAGQPGNEHLHAHAQLSRPGDEARTQEGKHHGGRHQHHAFGDGVKTPAAPNVSGGVLAGVGADELMGQTKPGAQVHGRGLLGDERVGASFDKEAILDGGGDLSAPVGRALD